MTRDAKSAAGEEDIEAFRLRARTWLRENMPPTTDAVAKTDADDEAGWSRARELQAILYKGGFAGLCYPREYGGQGMPREYQQVFSQESLKYEMPIRLNIPTLSICLPTILAMGTEQQKAQHIDAVLRGDEVLVEFLSEPHSGSDLAGALTRAEWNGENWILNGSKIWTSHAYVGDYALCLARTNWDVPKHQGLTMFLVPVKHSGITVSRIRQVNGRSEFCEEFFDNVVLGPEAVLGEVNGGWAVAAKRFYFSRAAWGRGNPYISGSHDLSQAQSKGIEIGGFPTISALARRLDPHAVQLPEVVVDAYVAEMARDHLAKRIIAAVGAELMVPEAASMVRLFHAEIDWLCIDASFEVAGSFGVTGPSSEDTGMGAYGETYLIRQATSLGGGSTEMARNVISERVLRMPREVAADQNIPFREARKRAGARGGNAG